MLVSKKASINVTGANGSCRIRICEICVICGLFDQGWGLFAWATKFDTTLDELNGYKFRASEVDATLQTLALAAGDLSEAAFSKWLKANSKRS